jgi:hypothetical protein
MSDEKAIDVVKSLKEQDNGKNNGGISDEDKALLRRLADKI